MTAAIQIELNGQNGDNGGRTSPEAGEHRFQTLRLSRSLKFTKLAVSVGYENVDPSVRNTRQNW